jgi:hypothetical protein
VCCHYADEGITGFGEVVRRKIMSSDLDMKCLVSRCVCLARV